MNGSLLDIEKLFYERFWALHNDPELLAVFKRFGIEAFRRSSVLEGFEAFVRDQGLIGKRCIEIGTRKGLTALVLARYFEEVVTLDIEPDSDRERIAEFCGVGNVRFVTVAGNGSKANFIRSLEFDAAYVDGDHARDTQSDFDLVRGCGRVLFHEYWPAQPSVFELVNALRARGTVISKQKLALWTS